jgi:DNA polymerase-3 subunit epsilon
VNRFAVVDVETSGLSLRRDRLLQVGVVVVDERGGILERWASLVRPRRRLLFRVGPTRLHGIRRGALRHAPPLRSVLDELARRLDGAVFVAHNARFDLGFLEKAAEEAGVRLPITTTLCTLRLSRELDPGRLLSHRLGAICERHGIELVRPHDALADADATAAVLPRLLAAHGFSSSGDLRDAEFAQPEIGDRRFADARVAQGHPA